AAATRCRVNPTRARGPRRGSPAAATLRALRHRSRQCTRGQSRCVRGARGRLGRRTLGRKTRGWAESPPESLRPSLRSPPISGRRPSPRAGLGQTGDAGVLLQQNRGMTIVVGVTGGIAAYKSVHLVRLLIQAGHDVTVIPTEDALRVVGQPTWEAI